MSEQESGAKPLPGSESVATARARLDQAVKQAEEAERAQWRLKARELANQCARGLNELRGLERAFHAAQSEWDQCQADCSALDRKLAELRDNWNELEFLSDEQEREFEEAQEALARGLEQARAKRLDAKTRVEYLRLQAVEATQLLDGLRWSLRNAKARAQGERFGNWQGGVGPVR